MIQIASLPAPHRRSLRRRIGRIALDLSVLALVLGCSGGESSAAPVVDVPAADGAAAAIDILPGVYPNQLTGAEVELDVVLTASSAQHLDQLGPLTASASASLDPGAPSVATRKPIVLRDTDGDGRPEAVASFAIADLRAAGLLGADTTRLAVRLDAGPTSVIAARDRLFDASAWLLSLPAPSGPRSVGTTAWWLEDPSRAGAATPARRIGVRVWYPARADAKQPADYFLDAREASLNATNNAMPADIFDRVHATSRLDAAADASERHPVLIMSTGWSAPVTLYSGIAEELASHGYVVIGLSHPDGSGAVVYPDGTDSGFDPETPSSDAAVESWALDIGFVARWLQALGNQPGADQLSAFAPRADVAREVVAGLDLTRVGALAHSLGGAAVVRAAVQTPSIRASANIDGSFRGPVLLEGPTTPVLVMLYDGHVELDPSPVVFHERGARSAVYEATVLGSGHNDFSDSGALVLQLASLDSSVVPAEQLVGPIDTARALSIESAYVRAFFDSELRGAASALMSGPAPEFPEVNFAAFPRAE